MNVVSNDPLMFITNMSLCVWTQSHLVVKGSLVHWDPAAIERRLFGSVWDQPAVDLKYRDIGPAPLLMLCYPQFLKEKHRPRDLYIADVDLKSLVADHQDTLHR